MNQSNSINQTNQIAEQKPKPKLKSSDRTALFWAKYRPENLYPKEKKTDRE